MKDGQAFLKEILFTSRDGIQSCIWLKIYVKPYFIFIAKVFIFTIRLELLNAAPLIVVALD